MPLAIKQQPKNEWTRKGIDFFKKATNFFGTAGVFFWLVIFFSILALFSLFFKVMALLTFIIFCAEYWGVVDKIKKSYTKNDIQPSLPEEPNE